MQGIANTVKWVWLLIKEKAFAHLSFVLSPALAHGLVRLITYFSPTSKNKVDTANPVIRG